MKKIKQIYPYIPLIIGFVYFVLLNSNTALVGDDLVYNHNLDNTSILQWCVDFYNSWGGRVPLQLLDILFLYHSLKYWIVFNSIIMFLFCLYSLKICNAFFEIKSKNNYFILSILLIFLFTFMPQVVLHDGAIWVTGSFNYLLPSTMLIVALYPFVAYSKNIKMNKMDCVLSILGTFLCCYAEQTAAVFVCMTSIMMILIFINNRSVDKKILVLYIFGLINAFVMFAAPGNSERAKSELICWYQAFPVYNLFDKIVLGVVHTVKTILHDGIMYFFVMLLVLGLIANKKSKMDLIAYSFLCFLTLFVYFVTGNLADEAVWQIYSIKILFKIALILFWILYFSFYLFYIFLEDKIFGIFTMFLFLAIFATGIVIGFSPTIYASGLRVFFISYILLILLSILLINKFLNVYHQSRVISD